MQNQLPPCPACTSAFTYKDAGMYICPECAHEWRIDAAEAEAAAAANANADADADQNPVYRDANGTELHDGDAVTVIKDLKVKGTSSVVKVGTKVKSIRLVEGDHDIDCKVDGIGQMKLKSEFVRKV